MKKDEAITVVVDVALKRKPHSRQVLNAAVAALESKPAPKKKTKAVEL